MAEDPLTASYYADGVHDYADVVFHVNGTMQKGEYKAQVTKNSLSILFRRAIFSRSFNKKILRRSWARSTARAALASSLGTTWR